MTDTVVYRMAREDDLPIVGVFYEKLDALLRKNKYAFPRPDQLGALYVESFQRTMGRFTAVLIAEVDGRVVGFILARVKRVPPYMGGLMVGQLCDMWVESEVRALGIGEKLLRLAIEWLRDQQVQSVEAQILVTNEPIQRVVTRLGLKPEILQFRMQWDEYNE